MMFNKICWPEHDWKSGCATNYLRKSSDRLWVHSLCMIYHLGQGNSSVFDCTYKFCTPSVINGWNKTTSIIAYCEGLRRSLLWRTFLRQQMTIYGNVIGHLWKTFSLYTQSITIWQYPIHFHKLNCMSL